VPTRLGAYARYTLQEVLQPDYDIPARPLDN